MAGDGQQGPEYVLAEDEPDRTRLALRTFGHHEPPLGVSAMTDGTVYLTECAAWPACIILAE